jgi:hypothetical protein
VYFDQNYRKSWRETKPPPSSDPPKHAKPRERVQSIDKKKQKIETTPAPTLSTSAPSPSITIDLTINPSKEELPVPIENITTPQPPKSRLSASAPAYIPLAKQTNVAPPTDLPPWVQGELLEQWNSLR